jgi:hypothetical protein
VQHKLTLMRKKDGQHQQLSPPAERAQHADGLRGHARHATPGGEIETPLEKMNRRA